MLTVDLGLVDNDLPDVPRLITGRDLILQRIRTRLDRWHGEWFLDNEVGILRLAWLTAKGLDINAVLGTVEAEIRGIPGVVTTTNASARLVSQELRIQFDVLADTGESVTVSVQGEPAGSSNGSPFGVFFRSTRIGGQPVEL